MSVEISCGLPPSSDYSLYTAALMEKMKKIKDLDMDKLKEMIAKNPHLQERMLESRGAFRNQAEEAKRITVEQMRQLQK